MNEQKMRLRNAGFVTFFFSGICAISSGVVVSLLQEQYGFAYGMTGTLLSLMSIGNLLAGFLTGVLPGVLGLKPSVLLLTIGYALGYAMMSLSGAVAVLALGFMPSLPGSMAMRKPASGGNREELLGQRPAGCKRQRSRRWVPQPGLGAKRLRGLRHQLRKLGQDLVAESFQLCFRLTVRSRRCLCSRLRERDRGLCGRNIQLQRGGG